VDETHWAPGTEISWYDGTGSVGPLSVVRDDKDGLVAWLPGGVDDEHDVLRVAPAGHWWSAWALFDVATHRFAGWQVSIEVPHTRDAASTRTTDLILDLRVGTDRSVRRTNQDELRLAVQQGRYNQAEAELITSVADDVETVVAAWAQPFSDGWETFSPAP
jgi:predicted RNA-binding protein associated with RNAse of E/G family